MLGLRFHICRNECRKDRKTVSFPVKSHMKMKWVASVFAFVGMIVFASIQAQAAVLKVDSSADMDQWQEIPAGLMTAGSGGIEVADDGGPREFFRLRLESAAGGSVVPVAEVDTVRVGVAQEFLGSFASDTNSIDPEEGGNGAPAEAAWIGANDLEIDDYARPIYDPAVDAGQTPAYYEFKVVRRLSTVAEGGRKSGKRWVPNDPSSGTTDAGYLLVSATPSDFPVVSFAMEGPTLVERLQNLVGSAAFRAVRYGPSFLAAEDVSGNLIGNLGSVPHIVDPAVSNIGSQVFYGEDDGTAGVSNYPAYDAQPAGSYAEFKSAYLNNGFFIQVRSNRAAAAGSAWDAQGSLEASAIEIVTNSDSVFFDDMQFTAAEVDDNNLILDVAILPTGGVQLWGGPDTGKTALRLVDTNGYSFVYSLSVVSSLKPKKGFWCGNWSNWRWIWSQREDLQCMYQQYRGTEASSVGMCTPSGCGPTAWAMLYGYWDRRSSPRLIGDYARNDAPANNNTTSVRDCTKYVYDRVGILCAGSGTATMPWTMDAGRLWAQYRGAGMFISWRWCYPGLGGAPSEWARSSLSQGYPSIIGIGFFSHYPLAIGYIERVKRCSVGSDEYQRMFWCNMGWGGAKQWEIDNNIWYGTVARFW